MLTVNKCSKFGLHIDNSNLGESAIVAIGQFTGGRLWVHGRDYLDAQHQLVRFSGNEPHFTESFDGERYSIVFYVHRSFPRVSPEDRAYLLSLGFRFPSDDWYVQAAVKACTLPTREVRLAKAQKALMLQTPVEDPDAIDVVDYLSDDPILVLDSSESSAGEEDGDSGHEVLETSASSEKQRVPAKPSYDSIVATLGDCIADQVDHSTSSECAVRIPTELRFAQ